MKLKLSIFTLAILISLGLKAELPEISKQLSVTLTNLPAKVSPTNEDLFIDMDGDGTYDFNVRYYDYSFAGTGWYNIAVLHNSPSGTSGQGITVTSYGTDAKMDIFGPGYLDNIEAGTEIGPTTGVGQTWQSYAKLMAKTNGQLSTMFDDDDNTGYIGLKYAKGSGSQYGWMQIMIDPTDSSATVLAKGIAQDINEPVIAGDAPLAPLSFIATFLGLGIIGLGAARRKRKKQ